MTPLEAPRNDVAGALAEIAEMPAFLESAMGARGAPAHAWRPRPDVFSLAEHACHLRDLEREGYLVRLRRILEEDVPELPGFDGTRIARERDYQRQDARAAAREFAAARAEFVAAASRLTPAQLAREARFGGRRITAAELIGMVAGHDAEHRLEIEALLADAARA
jgi:hypothetical protein